VTLDIGTGDGLFVYRSARCNPTQFFVGIDANTRPLQKISQKIYRTPAKGGAPNALFIQASVENLPDELNGIANEVHVHFPWGSLLRAVALGELNALEGIRGVCTNNAVLKLTIGLDEQRDSSEIQQLGLEALSPDFLSGELYERYLAARFEIIEHTCIPPVDWPGLGTSWAKRLPVGHTRKITYLLARAV
jgi:16S rRNA (adenine(1408)-N(1))-methyltransferase